MQRLEALRRRLRCGPPALLAGAPRRLVPAAPSASSIALQSLALAKLAGSAAALRSLSAAAATSSEATSEGRLVDAWLTPTSSAPGSTEARPHPRLQLLLQQFEVGGRPIRLLTPADVDAVLDMCVGMLPLRAAQAAAAAAAPQGWAGSAPPARRQRRTPRPRLPLHSLQPPPGPRPTI